ncbi:DUF4376 domain-containing protein [Xanthobacter sp. TB0136]|uniref:DUF4376 domain-containing protein n=1 Tax=Xanthobacter sp. TB0136 TaxID=3459177 RepID=UPI004039B496
MNYAIIDASGVATNIIVAGPDFEFPGHTLVPADGAQIGWLWDGETFTPPSPEPVDLDALKGELCAGVDAERDRRTDAGFEFQSVRYQSRPSDRENIAGAAVAALGAMVAGAQPGDLRWHGAGSDFTWIAEDNSLIPMDAQTVYAFGQAAMAHKQGLIFEARAIKDAVAAAEAEAAARAAAVWAD